MAFSMKSASGMIGARLRLRRTTASLEEAVCLSLTASPLLLAWQVPCRQSALKSQYIYIFFFIHPVQSIPLSTMRNVVNLKPVIIHISYD